MVLRSKEQCEAVKYHSGLQNFLINDGKEVILSDTGLSNESPYIAKKEGTALWMGDKVATFKNALAKAGCKPEDITKIFVTHKHPDHTRELHMFPNAKNPHSRQRSRRYETNRTIYCSTHCHEGYDNLDQNNIMKL